MFANFLVYDVRVNSVLFQNIFRYLLCLTRQSYIKFFLHILYKCLQITMLFNISHFSCIESLLIPPFIRFLMQPIKFLFLSIYTIQCKSMPNANISTVTLFTLLQVLSIFKIFQEICINLFFQPFSLILCQPICRDD